MELIVNGIQTEAVAGHVADLLEARGIDPSQQGVAVAVNDEIVPRAEWQRRELNHGDRVEIVTAMQGG